MVDGQAEPVKPFDFANGGRDCWDETVAKYATTLAVDAKRGNVDVRGPKEGLAAYRGVAKYQFRELVDLRKLEYELGARNAYWWSYEDSTRTEIPIRQFVDALYEYERRLGAWRKAGRVELHRRFGHMSNRTIRRTARQIGGEPVPHGEDCLCSQCGEWFRVELDEDEIRLNRSKVVPLEAT